MVKSQKVVIKIGHTDVLLPDDTGVAQVLKTLSRGIVVWNFGRRIQVRKEELELSMSYVATKTEFTDEDDQPLPQKPHAPARQLKALKPAPMLELMERGSGR